jgi:hypothetical protein
MQVVKNPAKEQWSKLLERPVLDASSLETNVANVLKEVKASKCPVCCSIMRI